MVPPIVEVVQGVALVSDQTVATVFQKGEAPLEVEAVSVVGVEVEVAHGRGPLLSVANGGRRTRLGKKDKGGKKNQEDGTRCVL